MVEHVVTTTAAPPTPVGLRSSARRLLEDERSKWIAAGLVAAPIIVALLSAMGRSWMPTSDRALILLRTLDVGGGDTPLTGVFSRYGWDHPGPLLFWTAAPLTRLLGPVGLAVTAGLVNAGAAVMAVVAAWRNGGPLLGWITAAAIAVLGHSAGATTLIDPWNPWLLMLPMLAFLLCAWGAALGDAPMLVPAVLTGTWCVQLHLGALPLVGAAAVAAVAVRVLARRRPRRTFGPAWVVVTLVVGVAAWSGTIIDQLVGDGNLSEIWSWTGSEGELVGWSAALRVAGTELGVPAPWMGAAESDGAVHIITRPIWSAIAVVTLAGIAGLVAWRRRERPAAMLVGLAIAASFVSVVSMARITDDIYAYLIRWVWAVAALVVIAGVWAAVVAARRPALRVGASTVAIGLVVAVGTATTLEALPVALPDERDGDAAATLAEGARPHLDRASPYRFAWLEGYGFGAVSAGVYADLVRHGFRLAVPSPYASAFHQRHEIDPSSPTVLVVSGVDRHKWEPQTPAERIAAFDPLEPVERAEATDLEAEIRAASRWPASDALDLRPELVRARLIRRGASAESVARLHQLQAVGDRYAVWIVSPDGGAIESDR